MNTARIKRFSPITLPASPAESTQRDGWDVVLTYDGEERGPWLVDLSHRRKWDVQSASLDAITLLGSAMPESPGQCTLAQGWLISRMNPRQAALWNIASAATEPPIEESCATETTDGLCLLALIGDQLPRIMEKLTTLDLFNPARRAPFLVQGPLLHIPSQIVIVEEGPASSALIAFSRGYGQSVAEAILKACKEFKIRPGGEKRWTARSSS